MKKIGYMATFVMLFCSLNVGTARADLIGITFLNELISIDQSSGAATLIGSTGFGSVSGLTWYQQSQPIPESTSSLLLGTGLGILGLGVFRRRRK